MKNNNFGSLPLDSAMIAINCLNGHELKAVHEKLMTAMTEKAEKHREAILTAIEAAHEDGFNIGMWMENGNSTVEYNRNTNLQFHLWVD